MALDLTPYFNKGISFDEYLTDIKRDIEEQNDPNGLLHHTELNDKRMKRLYKTIKFSDEQINEIKSIKNKVTLLIITEGWCGDASQILPILHKIVDENENINARIVYRDENTELIEEYNTNGSHSIPIIIGVDCNTYEPKFRFGPRPSFGMEMLAKYKADPVAYPKDQFYKDLQMTYNKDKGQTIFREIIDSIKSI